VTSQHAYLSSTLCRAGDGEVPEQVTRDTTMFLKEKQITGKKFLRLNGFGQVRVFLFPGSSLSLIFLFLPSAIGYEGPNYLQPTNLLSAFHSLHQNVEQGWIGGFKSGHFILYQIMISLPILMLMWGGGLGTNNSFEFTSNGNESLEGMIACLERFSNS